MADVYKVAVSMGIAGTIARDMGAMLRTMGAIDTRAQKIQRSIHSWGAAARHATQEIDRVTRAINAVHAPRAGRHPFGALQSSAQQAIRETNRLSATFGNVRGAARGTGALIGGWATRLDTATSAANRFHSALQRIHATAGNVAMPSGPQGGGSIRRGRSVGAGGHSGGGGGSHGVMAHDGALIAGAVTGGGAYHVAKDIIEQSAHQKHSARHGPGRRVPDRGCAGQAHRRGDVGQIQEPLRQ